MRWICFPDGSRYTLASDIQKFAELHGYPVPCEADGTRHPGTDCNAKMRTIFKDPGMRHTFKIRESSVVEVNMDDSFINEVFLNCMVQNEIVSNAYLKHRTIQLYTGEAVNALLSVMLKNHVEYEPDDTDYDVKIPLFVTKRNHSLEKAKNKPKASLFNK